MPVLQLVKVAFNVFNSRNQVQQRKDHWKVKQQATLLAAALIQGSPRPGSLQG